MRQRRFAGFTLIEILIVMGIIAVLALIAIANYVTGLERARQKRSMADMRTIATAWEARATEVKGYSAAGFTFPALPVAYDDLRDALVPTYANPLPQRDGWGQPFQFAADEAWGTLKAQSYGIRSSGRDRRFDSATYTPGQFDNFDCDVVYANGNFITYPSR
jgi:prepilin-type N-terminal cleavage/methylation domain-containing protein